MGELLHNVLLGLGIFERRGSVMLTALSCALKIVFGIGVCNIDFLHGEVNKSYPMITDPTSNLNWIGVTIAMLASLDMAFYSFGDDPLLKKCKIVIHIIYLLAYYGVVMYGLRSKNTTLYTASSIVIAFFSQMHPFFLSGEKIVSKPTAVVMALGSSFLLTILMGKIDHGLIEHVGFVYENIIYFISGPGILFISSQVAIHGNFEPTPFITFVMNCFTIYMAVVMNRSSLLVTSLLTIASFVLYLGYKVFKFSQAFVVSLAFVSVTIIIVYYHAVTPEFL